MIMDEFQNLAVMHAELSERMNRAETQLARLSKENQEIRELLTRRGG